MILIPCTSCRTPVYEDGTGLSGQAHHCPGPPWEQMECHCGAVVWVQGGIKRDQGGRLHRHGKKREEAPTPAAPTPPQVEAWGLQIDRAT